jgi:uncharacterized protein (TIGR02145 family)
MTTYLKTSLLNYALLLLAFLLWGCGDDSSTGPDPEPEAETGTVVDIDGNTYVTIKIGDQWWMAENLKVTNYRNGDPISKVTDAASWPSTLIGAYAAYDNDPVNAKIYGYLYNWKTVHDTRRLAPEGWHVPTRSEWDQLVSYLGGIYEAGGKLKQTGADNWKTPNEGASNSSGFNALPGGRRGSSDQSLGESANFWTASYLNSQLAHSNSLHYYDDEVLQGGDYRTDGLSVRCIMD